MAMRIALALCLLAVTAQAQVTRRVQGDGLVAWWPMESGGLSEDVAGGITATNINVTKTDSPFGGAGSFLAASSSRLNGGAVLALSNFTVAAWVYLPTTNLTNPMVVTRASDFAFNQNWLLFMRTPQNRWSLQVRSAGLDNEVLGAAVKVASWTHVAGSCVVTGSANPILKIYVNGVLEGSDSVGANPVTDSTLTFNIGAYNNSTAFLSGKIDDVRIYNRALSAQEISALVNSRRRNHSQ
jgi:hypothetical protein